MRKINQIWSFFMALLLASTILVSVGFAAPPQPPAPPTIPNVYVDPAAVVDPTVEPGETFTVSVMVTEVTDVFGWGFFLHYRSSVVSVQSVDQETLLMSRGDSEGASFPLWVIAPQQLTSTQRVQLGLMVAELSPL